MQRRRGADVDDVEVGHRQQLAEAYRGTGNAELLARAMQPFGIDVTQREHAKLIRQGVVTLGYRAAPDASADKQRPSSLCAPFRDRLRS